MPIGIQRLNAKKSQPNPRIVFIKPLKGRDEKIAQDFLERIAAQCLPIMKEHHLSVMSLEEYEPNREFVGRNFNAGEVIQLVLKSRSTGRWLPFNYVQMVMMHELAHCKQMNHSKAFWAVRNQYAEQMRTLWGRGYSGEGLWGRGALLATGEFEANTVTADEVLPEHLCGGTYRSRRKRRPKQQLSYQERKERRIRRKFGAGGVALGEDEDAKEKLEKGRKTKTQAKPRVASSNRGRELRAAAALARFDQKKKADEEDAKGPPEVIDLEDEESDKAASEANSDDETATEAEQEEATVDINGQRLLDNKGHSLVKVCEDENPEDGDAQNELRELLQSSLTGMKPPRNRDSPIASASTSTSLARKTTPPQTKHRSDSKLADEKAPDPKPKPIIIIRKLPTKAEPKADAADPKDNSPKTTIPSALNSTPAPASPPSGTCPMCSFDSGPDAAICSICSHVMDPGRVPGTWKCSRASCTESLFLNAGDAGVCGVCGARKAMSQ